jgi:hypothetical protein
LENENLSDEPRKRFDKIVPFPPLSKNVYADVLFSYYQNTRIKIPVLPKKVPEIVVETVRNQISLNPNSSLRECLRSLKHGMYLFLVNYE